MILARCPECSTTFRVRPEQLRARQGRVRCGQCNHAFNALETLVEEGAAAPPHVPPPLGGPALFVLEEKPAELPDPTERLEPHDSTLPIAAETALPEALDLPQIVEAEVDAEPVIEFGAEPLPDEPPPDAFLPDDTPPSPGDTAMADAVDALLLDADEVLTDAPSHLPLLDETDRREPVGEISPEAWPPAIAEVPEEEAPVTAESSPAEPFPDQPFPSFDEIPAFELPPDETSPPCFDEVALLGKLPIPDSLSLDLDAPHDEQTGANPTPSASPDVDLPPQTAGSEAPIDFDTLIHTRDPGHANEALTPPDAPAPRIDSIAPATSPAGSPDEDEDEDTSDTTDLPEETRSPALSQALWAAAATLLTLGVLAQGALVFRNEIALSSPQLRPALESLCAGLGCELPLPRHAADIAIESSDIQPDASREAYFTLHATLRNRAEFQQAWPHVEITLTDARDKALVRRVLEPAQWLPADAPKDAFPARGETAIRVAFEAPGVAAAGYRVYAFYP
mgnify:CR=1 FL=1